MATNLIKSQDAAMGFSALGKIADGDGLYLDVRSATSASWLFRFTFGGKADEVGLGSRKKVTLARARELRAWCLDELSHARNPKDALKSQKAEIVRAVNAPKAATIYELARDHIDVIAPACKSLKGRRLWVRSMHSDFLGPVADMAPGDVTLDDVLNLLVPLYTGKNRKGDVVGEPRVPHGKTLRERLGKVLDWAKVRGLITDPNWKNPAAWNTELKSYVGDGAHDHVKHASLPFVEVGGFVAKVRARTSYDRAIRFALEWTIISAARIANGVAADWSEIDLQNDCWDIPGEKMKMKTRHRVPLTDRHHEILAEILGDADMPKSGPIFVCAGASKAVTADGVRDLKNVLAPSITLHGFRTSFATWARAQRYEVQGINGKTRTRALYEEREIEESLSHVFGSEERNTYIDGDSLDARRELLDDWAAYCEVVQDATVITLRPRLRRAA